MFRARRSKIHLLDPGAGIGSLTAAFVERMLGRARPPSEICATLFEIDPTLIKHLELTMTLCQRACGDTGVGFSYEIFDDDFVKVSAEVLRGELFLPSSEEYDCVIMNPPYRKIGATSDTRHALRSVGIEVSNIYAGFMALGARLLGDGGEFVSISPRSFCNGPYFRHFRRAFLSTLALARVHLFESRKHAFKDDGVLQENLILHAIKSKRRPADVTIMVSASPETPATSRRVAYEQVVYPTDRDFVLHLPVDAEGETAVTRISCLPASLDDVHLSVSTGRVVDFRARSHLRDLLREGTVPLIYPSHFAEGRICWPNPTTKKPNAIVNNRHTAALLVPPGVYVLVKRFSAKEERRRIVAAVYDAEEVSKSYVGFENHLNYYHQNGAGLQREIAVGLALFLNASVVDTYFRQFSGHTQVNVEDLRRLRYPSRRQLVLLGREGLRARHDQENIDRLVECTLFKAGWSSDAG